jgi:hypothetical protein
MTLLYYIFYIPSSFDLHNLMVFSNTFSVSFLKNLILGNSMFEFDENGKLAESISI